MTFWLALLAAFGAAIFNGGAAILQKMGADKHDNATSADVSLLLKLYKDKPYLAGTLLDLTAWGLTLYAVQYMPLFVVQPITAFSIVITLCVEKYLFKRQLGRGTMAAIGLILAGLLLLAASASAEKAAPVDGLVRYALILAPVPLALAGTLLTRLTNHYATIALAAISGICFGGTAIVGRMMAFEPPYWHCVLTLDFLSIAAYGVVGILFFVIALQRNHASIINAAMISFETIVPTVIGIFALGDHPKDDGWPLLVFGLILATIGTAIIATHKAPLCPPDDAPAGDAGSDKPTSPK